MPQPENPFIIEIIKIKSVQSDCWEHVIQRLNAAVGESGKPIGVCSENMTQALRDAGFVPRRKSGKPNGNYSWKSPMDGIWEFSENALNYRTERKVKQYAAIVQKRNGASTLDEMKRKSCDETGSYARFLRERTYIGAIKKTKKDEREEEMQISDTIPTLKEAAAEGESGLGSNHNKNDFKNMPSVVTWMIFNKDTKKIVCSSREFTSHKKRKEVFIECCSGVCKHKRPKQKSDQCSSSNTDEECNLSVLADVAMGLEVVAGVSK
eukprot:2267023-Rhodomonas_salina.2